jgi:hypothetical protein
MIPGYDLKEEDKETAVVFKPLLRRKKQKHQWIYTSPQKVSTPYWICKRLVAINLREQV